MKNRQHVFITGGSRGIGRGIVKAFCQEGAKVAFSYNSDEASSRSLIDECASFKGHSHGFQLDVSDFSQTAEQVKNIKYYLDNRIDVLVNNAGVIRDKSLMMMTEEDWDFVLDINLKGIYNVTKLFVVDFCKQKCGSIINITSISGLKGMPGQTNYSASKAGIIGFTRSLSREIIRFGVTVNAVAPGFIDTEMLKQMGENKLEQMKKEIPAGRLGSVSELAEIVKFIASNNARYMTGQVITVDGGLSV